MEYYREFQIDDDVESSLCYLHRLENQGQSLINKERISFCRSLLPVNQELTNAQGFVCPYPRLRKIWGKAQLFGWQRSTAVLAVQGAFKHLVSRNRTFSYVDSKDLITAQFGDFISDNVTGGYIYKNGIENIPLVRLSTKKSKKAYIRKQKVVDHEEWYNPQPQLVQEAQIVIPKKTLRDYNYVKEDNSYVKITSYNPPHVQFVPSLVTYTSFCPKVIHSSVDSQINDIINGFKELLKPTAVPQGKHPFKNACKNFKNYYNIKKNLVTNTGVELSNAINEIVDELTTDDSSVQTAIKVRKIIPWVNKVRDFGEKIWDNKWKILAIMSVTLLSCLLCDNISHAVVIIAAVALACGMYEIVLEWLKKASNYISQLILVWLSEFKASDKYFDSSHDPHGPPEPSGTNPNDVFKYVVDSPFYKPKVPLTPDDNCPIDPSTFATAQGIDDEIIDYSKLAQPISGIIGTGVVMLMAKSDDRKLPEIHKLAAMTKSLSAIKTLPDCLTTSAQLADDWIFESITGIPSSLRTDNLALIEVENWNEKINDTVVSQEWMEDLYTNKEKIAEIYDIIKVGKDILIKYNKVEGEIKSMIQNNLRLVERIKNILDEFASKSHIRKKPLVVFFHGPSQIGKTSLITRFTIDIWSKVIPKEHKIHYKIEDLVYTKPSGEYYDDYRNNFAFFWDEFLQNIQLKQDSVEDALEFIQLANSADLKLNTAACNLKNKFSFCSPLILLTSNYTQLEKVELACPQALTNRISLKVETILKDEFKDSTNLLDSDKWIQHCEQLSLDSAKPDYLKFIITRPNGQKIPCSYDELVSKSLEYYNSNDFIQTQLIKQNEDYFKTAQAQSLGQKTFLGIKSEINKNAQSSRFSYLKKGTIHPISILAFFKITNDPLLDEVSNWEEWVSSQEDSVKSFVTDFNNLDSTERVKLYMVANTLFSRNEIDRHKLLSSISTKCVIPDILTRTISKEEYQEILAAYVTPKISVFNQIKSSFQETIQAYPYISIFSAIAMAFGIIGLVSHFLFPKIKAFFESKYNGTWYSRGKAKLIKRGQRESLLDSNLEALMPKLINSCSILEIIDDVNKVFEKTNGIVICNNNILSPRHLFKDFVKNRPTLKLRITYKNTTTTVPLSELKITRLEDMFDYDDCVIIELKSPHGISSPSIIDKFIKKKDINKLVDCKGELLVKRVQSVQRFIINICNHSKNVEEDSDLSRVVEFDNLDKTHSYSLVTNRGWNYDAPTQPGDCGSMLIGYLPNSKEKILGFHCASLQECFGFSCIITQEQLSKICNIKEAASEGLEFKIPPSYLSKEVKYLGHSDQVVHLPTRNPTRTSILSKKLNWETFTSPALLYPDGDIQPLKKAMEKYTSFEPNIDDIDFNKTLNYMYYKFCNDPSRDRNLLDNFEIVNGLKDDTLQRINPHSSPGFPYCLTGKRKTPDLLNFDGEFYTLKPEFLEELNIIENDISNYESIWIDYLKAERLPKEKVLLGKARLISCCPFPILCLVRKYFGNFNAHLHRNWMKYGVAVGINPHGGEWSILAEKLKTYKYLYDEDFKAWDATIPKRFLNAYIKIANVYYNDSHSSMRISLGEHMFNCIHQVQDVRYMPYTGNPSGNPLTVEINSICNIFIHYYVYIHYFKLNIGDLENHIFIMTYGDDVIVATNILLDGIDIYMSKLGMQVTCSNKSGPPKITSIYDLTFLKRKFVILYGQWVSPLPLNIIKESLLWHDSSVNMKDSMWNTLLNFLIEIKKYELKDVKQILNEVFDACYLTNQPLPFDEIFIDSRLCFPESYSYLNKLAVWFYSKCYSKFSNIVKIPCDVVFPKMVIPAGIDLSSICYGLPLDTFYHVGFIDVEDPNIEYTFSSSGICIIKAISKPLSKPIEVNSFLQHLPRYSGAAYHSWNNNCMNWFKNILNNTYHRNNPKYKDHWIKPIYENFCKFRLEMFGSPKAISQGIEPLLEDMPEEINSGQVTMRADLDTKFFGAKGKFRSIKDVESSSEIISSFSWKTTDISYKTISSINLPSELWKIPQLAQKIRYNTLLRGSLKFWLTVETTPFHQGLLFMYWIPQASLGFPNNIEPNELEVTVLPGVYFNAGNKKECFLEVPYINNQVAINLLKPNINSELGILYVKVINELSTSVASSVDCKIFVSFDDLEVIYPTSGKLAQDNPTYSPTTASFLPCLNSEIINPEGEGEEKTQSGIISGISETVSGVARLVGRIPIFSNVAGFIARTADTVTTIARFLGLSKPISQATTLPIIPRPFSSVSFADGLDMAIPLGTDPKNCVRVMSSLFGTQVDEMSLKYVIKTPMIVNTIKWTNLLPYGSIIASIPVHPLLGKSFFKTVGGINVPMVQFTPMGYVASAFTYYRGSIQFKVEVICTALHAGSLLITYHPSCNTIPEEPIRLTEVSSKNLKIGAIIEDKSINVLEFTCSYVADTPYMKVGSVFDKHTYLSNTVIGTLNISVLNQLVRPETVSSTVEINIWASAGEDMEFALPTLSNITNYYYGTDLDISSRNFPIAEGLNDRNRLQWQMGSNSATFKCFENIDNNCNDIVMGEQIFSIKDLLRISCKYFSIEAPKKLTKQLVLPRHKFLTNTELSNYDGFTDTYYDHFARIYRYSRGTLVHRWIGPSQSVKFSASLGIYGAQKQGVWLDTLLPHEGAPWAVAALNLNPTLEYSIPYFNHMLSTVHGSDVDDRQILVEYYVLDTPAEGRLLCYFSIGDDFSAGFLMPPPLCVSKSSMLDPLILKLSVYYNTLPKFTYFDKENTELVNPTLNLNTSNYDDRKNKDSKHAMGLFYSAKNASWASLNCSYKDICVIDLTSINPLNHPGLDRILMGTYSKIKAGYAISFMMHNDGINTKTFSNALDSQRFGGVLTYLFSWEDGTVTFDFITEDFFSFNDETAAVFIPYDRDPELFNYLYSLYIKIFQKRTSSFVIKRKDLDQSFEIIA